MTVPNDTVSRRSPEDPARPFVPVRELVEQLMGGLPSEAAVVPRLADADPIQDWEAHGPAPHSAALLGCPTAADAGRASPAPEPEAPDGVQLSLVLDPDSRPDYPAVRFFDDRGLHHRHWTAASRIPWLQVNAENSLAAFAYMDVARCHYEALVAVWLPPATWTVLDGRGRLSVAWALQRGVHWNRGSWAWRRRMARTIDHELALGLGALGQIGRNIDAPIPRRLHANPAASPSPWKQVHWTGECYRLRHLDRRSLGSTIVTAGGSGAPASRGTAGGLASGTARQVIAAERRALVASLADIGLSTRAIAAAVEAQTGRKVTTRTVRNDRKALGLHLGGRKKAIIEGVREGFADDRVAQVLECSPRTVQRHRIGAGLIRPQGRPPGNVPKRKRTNG